MTTPTPEEFLAQTEPDEDDEVLPEWEREVLEQARIDPLTSIAASLNSIAGAIEAKVSVGAADEQLRTTVADLEAEVTEIEALHDAKQALIDEVLAICKPSTSKLANSIRAVLEPVVTVAQPAPEPAAEPPAHDADVEQWREYARDRGVLPDEPDAIDSMNRSQIRTLLGIPHAEPVVEE